MKYMAWDDLSRDRQDLYLEKAAYLVDRGYISDYNESIEDIARKMYERETKCPRAGRQ